MPPKSSSKKSQVSWYFCENCKVNIIPRDREDHDKICPIKGSCCGFSFIRDEIFYITTFEPKAQSKELAGTPLNHLNNLIQLSEGVLGLCRFVIGEPVSISCCDYPQVPPIVRAIWPLPEKLLTTVFVSEEDFRQNWEKLKGLNLQIEKLSEEPKPADEIHLVLDGNSFLNSESIQELTKILKVKLMQLIFCIGNQVIVKYYDKEIKLIITDLKCKSDTDDGSSLEQKLEKLSFGNHYDRKFYEARRNTKYYLQLERSDVKICNRNNVKKLLKSDIGGLEDVIEKVQESVDLGLGVISQIPGIKISRGLLLFGPSGCGKSMICEAIANESNANIIKINTSELFSKYVGETEQNLNKLFEKAFQSYPRPSLIIIEDINNICPKHDTNDLVKRLSTSFLGILDSLHLKVKASKTFILATTNNIENLSPSVRTSGRLDTELEVGVPNPNVRLEIIKKYLKRVGHNLTDDDIKQVADKAHGFVGSDLSNLISKASICSLKRNASPHNHGIDLSDINNALNLVKPSAMREILIESPNVKWEDIGGQHDLKLKLKQAIEWPLLYPEKFIKFGIKPPCGILMFGPPGCSKTMIAKALATESKLNFLSIKGSELFSMWVGESERAVREVFRKARQMAPSIIFFDEIDAIGGERSSESGSSVKERVLTQMLTELDGVNSLNNVTIVAATNRPDMIDKALIRPGRIDRMVYVGLPDTETRREILKIKLKNMPLSDDVDIENLVLKTEGYSGAEIQAICQAAALHSLEEDLNSNIIKWRNFEHSLSMVQPRTSSTLLKLYDDYLKQS